MSGVVSKDLVHIFVPAPPTMAPREISRIKGRTAIKLFEEFPKIKKGYREGYFWIRGYFCITYSKGTDKMIQHYLEHHFESNKKGNFEIEG